MSEFSCNTDYTRTWMLFEGGTGMVVDLSLYSPSRETNRPVDAYVVTECEGDFTGSARRAAEAVYDIARQYRPEIEPVVVGYDLQGLSGRQLITGESGGLAFAIAFAKKLFEQDPGPVAATGEVRSGHGGGPVGPIKGIKDKLEAAGRMLPENGWIFYPRENDREISEQLRKSLESKGLKLRPVSSVAETIGQLFKLAKPGRRQSRWLTGGFLLVLFGIALAAGFWLNGWKPFTTDVLPDKGEMAQVKTARVPPDSVVKIDMLGETTIAHVLAQLLTVRLTDLFKEGYATDQGQTRLSGRVMVLRITEDHVNDKGDLRSEMTVAVKSLSFKSGKYERNIPVLKVSVKGEGPAKSLLSQLASALTNEIARVALKTIPDRSKDTKDIYDEKGFE